MQYINSENEAETKFRYILIASKIENNIYLGSTRSDSVPTKAEDTFYGMRYFARKGFYQALDIDPDIITPIYVDNQGKEVSSLDTETAKRQIFEEKLAIHRFEFKEGVSEKDKDTVIKKLIECFYYTSQNADLRHKENSFRIYRDSARVEYNYGGPEDVKITATDIKKQLGLMGNSVNKVSENINITEQKMESGKDYVLDLDHLPELKLGPEGYNYNINLEQYKGMLSGLHPGEKVEIGRTPDTTGKYISVNEAEPNAQYVSGKHAFIEMGMDGKLHMTDTSRNGTTIKGQAEAAKVQAVEQPQIAAETHEIPTTETIRPNNHSEDKSAQILRLSGRVPLQSHHHMRLNTTKQKAPMLAKQQMGRNR